MFIDTLLLDTAKGSLSVLKAPYSCQEVVLVGDGSLVLNSWETSCIIRLEKSLGQSVFFWLWTVDLKLSDHKFPSCLTCMSTNSAHKY